jgi:hypothetical protein
VRSSALVCAACLAVATVVWAPRTALADVVQFRLSAPQRHPGVQITRIAYLQLEGGTLHVLREMKPQIVTRGRGDQSLGFSLPRAPDAVEVDFAIPSGSGATTTLSIPPGQFVLGTRYFLPAPSPGGTVGPQPGNPATDASFRVSAPSPRRP